MSLLDVLSRPFRRLRIRTIRTELAVLRVEPGDTLVLRVAEKVPTHVLADLQTQMAKEFQHLERGVRFAILGNGLRLEVVRGEAPEVSA